ncbi:MAG: hypothetical protein Q7U56_02855 [Humidesulfovibrio sp.]|nr:hypothetical protein [Humidesulfovibrio sp.]
MEGVSTVMPLAINMGTGILKNVLSGAGGSGGGDPGVSAAAEARAQAALAQADRKAEAEQQRARGQAESLREEAQQRRARARVAAASSGLTLSGSSLLSLQGLEHAQGEQVGELLGDSSRRVQDILASGAEQAQSICLSGRQSRAPGEGLGSLLRLGGQVFSGGGRGGYGGVFTTFPTD